MTEQVQAAAHYGYLTMKVAAYPEFDGRGVAFLAEGDEEVCYMMREEARRLLHLPEHIFKLLELHCRDEHADRNMCTHVVQFTRHKDAHLLVSAHPIFRDSAYIMGNTNEPSRGPPSMELTEMQVALLDDGDPLMVRAGVRQAAEAVLLFNRFVLEHDEVRPGVGVGVRASAGARRA